MEIERKFDIKNIPSWMKERCVRHKKIEQIYLMIDFDKDGNRNHNDLDNLELLCPNCHSLTPNYKYLNSQRFKDKIEDI